MPYQVKNPASIECEVTTELDLVSSGNGLPSKGTAGRMILLQSLEEHVISKGDVLRALRFGEATQALERLQSIESMGLQSNQYRNSIGRDVQRGRLTQEAVDSAVALYERRAADGHNRASGSTLTYGGLGWG